MLPNFLIIGAAKCGTTTLYDRLAQHPEVFVSRKKEPAVFLRFTSLREALPTYERLFDGARDGQAVGEASVGYTLPNVIDYVAPQIRRYLPECRLIYMVRNPIRRLESDWKMRSLEGRVTQPISRAVDLFSTLVTIGLYWKHLNVYRQYFADEQILVVFLEDLAQNPEVELARVCRHIGVDDSVELPAAEPRNTAEQRRRAEAVGALARRVPMIRRLKHVLPRSLADRGAGFVAKLKPYPEVEWDPTIYGRVVDFLAPDSARFLEHCGKPRDFWDFDLRPIRPAGA